ncbi:MIP/aquaporin family protein [Tersicoccus solisilvae]|nr:aquaporin [Tersicoccus solisilvae]
MAADPGRTPLPADHPDRVAGTDADGAVTAPTGAHRPTAVAAARVGDLASPVPAAATKEGLDPEALERGAGPWARAGAEAIGTFLVIFGGLGAVLAGLLVQSGGVPGPVAIGLAMTVGVLAFGHVSGGHFNPALTLGAAIAGRTRWAHTPFYLLGQLVGGFAAAGLLYLVLRPHPQLGGTLANVFTALSNGYDSHSPTQFPLTSVLLVEAIGTALFVAAVLGATTRRANNLLAALAAGFALTVVLAVTAPISNGGINPVRATVSALFAEGWAVQQLWVFWAAPLLGGLLAGLVFRSFLPVVPRDAGAAGGAAPGATDDADTLAGERAAGTPRTVTVRRDADDADRGTTGPTADRPTSDHEVRDFFDHRGGER